MMKRFIAMCIFALVLSFGTAEASVLERFYIDLGVGDTYFVCTICDAKDSATATWDQTGMPNKVSRNSFAWKTGLGYRIDDHWSAQASYLNMGTTKINLYYTVSDDQYNPRTHSCIAPCTNQGGFYTHDLVEGAEFTGSYRWTVDAFKPYIKLGGAALYHRLTAQFGGTTLTMHGWIPVGAVGAGIEYGKFYVDSTYYHGFQGGTNWGAGLPISNQMVMMTVGIRVPLDFN